MENNYKVNDKMRVVLANDYRLLQVLSRFGISFGFGERTISDVCSAAGVDPDSFVNIINFVKNGGAAPPTTIDEKSVRSLLDYLKGTHRFFIDYEFPTLRRGMLNAIDCSGRDNEIAFLVLKFFDEYVEEVKGHMQYEEQGVFRYAEDLLAGNEVDLSADRQHSLLSRHHESIDNKLGELKNLFVQYYPGKGTEYELNAVVMELYRAQEELEMHCRVEDELFVPAVRKLAHSTHLRRAALTAGAVDQAKEGEQLSERERDVIRCVARGMSNKEIANELCLSVNTITTHRRNIARKLSIHTSAGITIYAIVNKIVRLEEIKQ